MIELLRFQRENGKEPFTEWLQSVWDKVAQARIRIRLRQVEAGNMGSQASDIKPAKAYWAEWKRRQS